MRLTATVLASALAASSMVAATPSRLPIIEDDYARARSEAKRREVPLFVDVWAPW
jgi:hypothetical protein